MNQIEARGRYPDRRDGWATGFGPQLYPSRIEEILDKSVIIIIIVVVIASSFLTDKGYIEPETTTWKMRLSTYR